MWQMRMGDQSIPQDPQVRLSLLSAFGCKHMSPVGVCSAGSESKSHQQYHQPRHLLKGPGRPLHPSSYRTILDPPHLSVNTPSLPPPARYFPNFTFKPYISCPQGSLNQIASLEP